MDHGGHSLLLNIHTLSSLSLLCWIFVSASMADCDLFYEAVDSGLFENLCCRFHTRICLLPLVFLVIELSLLILGLDSLVGFSSSFESANLEQLTVVVVVLAVADDEGSN